MFMSHKTARLPGLIRWRHHRFAVFVLFRPFAGIFRLILNLRSKQLCTHSSHSWVHRKGAIDWLEQQKSPCFCGLKGKVDLSEHDSFLSPTTFETLGTIWEHRLSMNHSHCYFCDMMTALLSNFWNWNSSFGYFEDSNYVKVTKDDLLCLIDLHMILVYQSTAFLYV